MEELAFEYDFDLSAIQFATAYIIANFKEPGCKLVAKSADEKTHTYTHTTDIPDIVCKMIPELSPKMEFTETLQMGKDVIESHVQGDLGFVSYDGHARYVPVGTSKMHGEIKVSAQSDNLNSAVLGIILAFVRDDVKKHMDAVRDAGASLLKE